MQQLQSGWRFIWGSKGSLFLETCLIEGAAQKKETVAGMEKGMEFSQSNSIAHPQATLSGLPLFRTVQIMN